MNKEEKEAIEELKKFSNLVIEGGIPNSFIVNKLKITFNLIDKLQKENEELKRKTYIAHINDKGEIQFVFDNYISKDKIRELAQDYKPNQSNTFIESQERYIELVKKLELLGDDE